MGSWVSVEEDVNNGPDIISDSSITSQKLEGAAEQWDGYRKTFIKNYFGINEFIPPRSVTNPTTREPVKILCECRDIPTFMWIDIGKLDGANAHSRKLNPIAKNILNGSINPACWEEKGVENYSIKYKLKAFYDYAKDPNGGSVLMLSPGGKAKYNNVAPLSIGPFSFFTGSIFSLFGAKRGGHRKRTPDSSRRLSKPRAVRSQALNSRRRRHKR